MLGLTILTACLQLHVYICVGVNMGNGVNKQLPCDRNAVCVGCGTSVFYCNERDIICRTVLYYDQKDNIAHCVHYGKYSTLFNFELRQLHTISIT